MYGYICASQIFDNQHTEYEFHTPQFLLLGWSGWCRQDILNAVGSMNFFTRDERAIFTKLKRDLRIVFLLFSLFFYIDINLSPLTSLLFISAAHENDVTEAISSFKYSYISAFYAYTYLLYQAQRLVLSSTFDKISISISIVMTVHFAQPHPVNMNNTNAFLEKRSRKVDSKQAEKLLSNSSSYCCSSLALSLFELHLVKSQGSGFQNELVAALKTIPPRCYDHLHGRKRRGKPTNWLTAL